MPKVAEMICSDPDMGGHYTIEGLTAQMTQRIESGTGRSYCIEVNGEIVAHTATYAETDGVAIVGGTIVKPGCGPEVYMRISNYAIQDLMGEGKAVYTFNIVKRMVYYHKRLHKEVAEYGKLTQE
jgi:hypothetical protein